jgi:hypothetical protein
VSSAEAPTQAYEEPSGYSSYRQYGKQVAGCRETYHCQSLGASHGVIIFASFAIAVGQRADKSKPCSVLRGRPSQRERVRELMPVTS